jgi:DMSO/TMAO reductase YedYZ molybdopterin-dependent catalytic subunit
LVGEYARFTEKAKGWDRLVLTAGFEMHQTRGLSKAHGSRLGREARRREFLFGALGGLTAASLLAPTRLLGSARQRRPLLDAISRGLATSNADFFVRNHFAVPTIRDDAWTLEVTGLVSAPVKVSYPDLLLMPSVRKTVTLECAGNPPGGTLVGTSVWSGVPLATLLKLAGIRQGARTIVLHGADSGDSDGASPGTHFARAIPAEKAMDPSTLLAYEMNGDPLPLAHGFPVRALISGWYGMDSVKWLTRIEVLDRPFEGFFQQQRYVSVRGGVERQPITRMSVSSKIVRPSEGEEIRSGAYRVEGVAWAGERRVAKVQVWINGSGDWQPASLQASPVAMVWTPWNYDWRIPGPGRYTLDVRATDEDGASQPGARDSDRKDPYQLNTPHRVTVNVRV